MPAAYPRSPELPGGFWWTTLQKRGEAAHPLLEDGRFPAPPQKLMCHTGIWLLAVPQSSPLTTRVPTIPVLRAGRTSTAQGGQALTA